MHSLRSKDGFAGGVERRDVMSVSDSRNARRCIGAGLGLLIGATAVTFVTVASVPNAPTTLACYGGLVVDLNTGACVPDDSGAPAAEGANMPHCDTVEMPGGSSIACAPGEFQYDATSPAGSGGR